MTPNLPAIRRDRQTCYLTIPLDLAFSRCLGAIYQGIAERYSFQPPQRHGVPSLENMIHHVIESTLNIILPSRLLDRCCDVFMVDPNELWEDGDSDEWEHPLTVFREDLGELLGANDNAMGVVIYQITIAKMDSELIRVIREEIVRYNYHRDTCLIGATVTDDGMGVLLTVTG